MARKKPSPVVAKLGKASIEVPPPVAHHLVDCFAPHTRLAIHWFGAIAIVLAGALGIAACLILFRAVVDFPPMV